MVTVRNNDGGLRWLRALAFTLVGLAGFGSVPFYPSAVGVGLAVGGGMLTLASPGLGVLALVVALSLPVAAANLTVGILMLLLGLALSPYLSKGRTIPFLVLGLGFAALGVHGEWAVVAFAGLALGAGEGAIAAGIAGAAVELAALLIGTPVLGSLASGVDPRHPVLVLDKAPKDALSFTWVGPALEAVKPEAVLAALSASETGPLLVAQPLVWAAIALAAGYARKKASDPQRRVYALVGTPAAVALGWALTAVLGPLLGSTVPPATVASTGMVGIVVAAIAATLSEFVFTPEAVSMPSDRTRTQREEADVDELLALIATAEEKIASRHTVEAVVMLTDMKSFSALTEQEGSITSAKMVQRLRDLLLPIIERHGGRGKSTGGDGLVAAFPSPAEAVAAGAEMQRELLSFAGSHQGEPPMLVRIGIASGEVVVDKSGRPFIGNALNLAARVMDLGDGGQLLVTGKVVDAAGGTARAFDHGMFSLKNIAKPVDVREVMWNEGQMPKTLRAAPISAGGLSDTA